MTNVLERKPAAAVPAENFDAAAAKPAIPAPVFDNAVFRITDLNIRYGSFHAIKDARLDIAPRQVTAIIGPSGCGKTTLLRALNRMNDFIPSHGLEGEVLHHGRSIYGPGCNSVELRRRVGMVFQKPNPFPKSIYRNVAWGALINGFRGDVDELVRDCLQKVGLWSEVESKLRQSALALSGGQQQRLCIARAIALQPEVILMDEPCSALDPIATARIEDLIVKLKEQYTVVMVTHNMQQASRVSDWTAFMYMGRLIEFDRTADLFMNPKHELTKRYITGRFG